MMNRLIIYIKRIFTWIGIGKFHITTFLVFSVTLLYLFNILKECSQFISYFFIVIGLSLILMQQLVDAKMYANYKPNTIGNWIRSFPKIKPSMVNLSANSRVTFPIKAHISSIISDDASLEKKVEHLLREIGVLDKRINEIDNNLENIKSEISSKAKELTSNIEKVSDVLKSNIAGHIIGSYDINILGIMITLCGTLIQIYKTP